MSDPAANSISRMNDTSLAGQPGRFSRRREILISLFLVLATLAVYWPVQNFDFVNIDDFAYVTQNADVQRGLSWANFKWAFQAHFAGNWHPLTTLSHMLDCQWFGVNAGPHHLTNLFFHTLNALLLFALLRKMTGALWRSAMVAAFFAVHPLHVESVAWISERKDVLSGFFFLLTLWAYARYADAKIRNSQFVNRNYLLSLFFFALGLLSKPMLVTLPFVLLLLDFWPLNRLKFSPFEIRILKFIILEKLPFFALAAASSVVTFFAQRDGGAVVALEHYPILPRIANALVSYLRYLGKTICPKSLAVFYPYEGGWVPWQPVAAVVLLAAISIAALWFARRRPYWFVGWFWFLGMLVPVIGLVQVGAQSMADRYTYLPHIGLFIALVWLVSEGAPVWNRLWAVRKEKPVPDRRAAPLPFHRACVLGAGALLLACVVVSSRQVRHWRNTETLLQHAVAVTTGNAPAHYYLGSVFDLLGKTNEAAAQYVRAIRINPNFADAHCNLGNILARQNKTVEALAEYSTALQLRPDFAPAHYGLAELFDKQGNMDEAKNHYVAAVRARPDFPEAHYQLAVLLTRENHTAETISHFKEAIRLKPDWLEPLNNLAWLLATHPDPEFRDGSEAVKLAERACALTKNKNPGAMDTLAAAYAEAGDFPKAVAVAAQAVALADGNVELQSAIQLRLELFRGRECYRE